ncbi:MAG: DUF2752 domain-containing protein [Bacteroidetes bacterium]|nr:DUF2752 domain-containing protein [Bacteroidota bacterium]
MSRKNLYILVLGVAFAACSWVIVNHFLIKSNLPRWNVCWFRQITGIPCPSCGTTHSVLSIMKGNFRQALDENILGFPAVVMILTFPLWVLTDILFKKESFYKFYKWVESLLQKKWVAWTSLILLLTYWIWHISGNL